MNPGQLREGVAALWVRIEDSRHDAGLRLRFTLPASLLVAALLTMVGPASLGACSKGTFSPVQPEFYFLFTALPDTVDAGWSGALRVGGQPLDDLDDLDHPATEGPRWAQVVRLEQAAGEAARQLPDDAERLILVPWDYGPACRSVPWQRSARFLEVGERGLMYATLRDPEHWVDGVPTADFHQPYSQPFPRRARYTLPPLNGLLMGIDDAFRFHHVLPRQADREADAEAAVAPMLEWARQNPELAQQGPANDMIRRNLRYITNVEVRRLEVPVAGTYRFVLDLGDGAPRTFYARTRSAPGQPVLPESGDDWFNELRPPSYGGYTLWAESAPEAEMLGPARAGQPGGALYIFLAGDPGDAAPRRIPGAAELTLATRALPDDPDVQVLLPSLRERSAFREYIDRNLGPGADAFFLLHADGAVTFEQTYHLPDGQVVTLRGVRIQVDHGGAGSGT